MAETPEEDQRRRRRKLLVRGLVVGSAALGVPALLNALVARRAKRLPAPRWGEARLWAAREGAIRYQHLGDGARAVVLVHSIGPGHSALQWRDVAERLAPRHEVYAPDLLGWGASDHPQVTYDSHLYIDLLTGFLAEVVQRQATVVAAGLSAAHALQVAVDHPELIGALGLVVPLGVDLHGDEPDLKDAVVHRLLRLPILGTSALNVFTSRAGIAAHLQREVFADPERVDEALIDEYYRASHVPGAQATLAAHLSGYLNHSVDPILPRIEQPVWIAWGREARSPSLAIADLWLRDLSTRAELEVFDHAALQPHAERPEAFAQALDDFLTRSGS
ncbi:MAG TPA: alpha/beta fold hydrolase [Thermoanaerobaculia bacterium]|nr:alpha/beta fold hydrolase [Thermoanaerobaculia bacterium]